MENPDPHRSPESPAPTEDQVVPAQPVGDRPVRRGASRKKLFLWLLTVGLVVVGGAPFVWRAYQGLRALEDAAAESERKKRHLRQLFKEAMSHLRERHWEEARVRMLEYEALDPLAAEQDYVGWVEKARLNFEHLTAARAALEAQKLAVARAELDRVNENAPLDEPLKPLKDQLREAADRRVREARALLGDRQQEQALAILEDVVAAFPDHADAQSLKRELRSP